MYHNSSREKESVRMRRECIRERERERERERKKEREKGSQIKQSIHQS
jgi:heme exporter protein D